MAEFFDSLPAANVLRTFVQCLIAACSRRPEAISEVISGRIVRSTVPDERVKRRDPGLNPSGEIRPKAVGCGIFGRLSNFDKCRPEVAGDFKFGVALVHVLVDVCEKFC